MIRKRVHLFYCLVSALLALTLGRCQLFTTVTQVTATAQPARPTMPAAVPGPTQTAPLPTVAVAPELSPTAAPPDVAALAAPYSTAPVAGLPPLDRTPQPTVIATPGTFPWVDFYQFVDAQTALAVVGPDFDQNLNPLPGTFHLLRSTDGTHTWQDITPGEVVNGSLTGVLNASIFWVKSAPDDPMTGQDTLYRTTDGGQTWQKIAAPFAMAGIHMVDAQNGWAIASPDGCGAGTCWVELYFTGDGGQTWNPYRPQPPLHSEPAMSDTTFSMTSGSDLQFPAPDILWFGGGSIDYGTPDLLISRDRGQTWEPVQVSIPQGLNLEYLHLPAFLNENEGFLTLTVSLAAEPASDRRLTAIYGTSDGGRTWTLRPLVEFGGWNDSVQFATASDWFANCRGALCRTTDGGQTWQALPLPQAPGATSVTAGSFFDARNGYAIARFATQDYLEYQEIYATSDGGQTWTKLEPVIK